MDRLQDHTESPVDPSGSQQPNKTLMRFKGGAAHFQPALFIPLLNIAVQSLYLTFMFLTKAAYNKNKSV